VSKKYEANYLLKMFLTEDGVLVS